MRYRRSHARIKQGDGDMLKAGKHHLAETQMGYGSHLRRAWRIGSRLAVAGGACFIHGLLPGLFKDKASRTIIQLHEEVKSGPQHGGERMMLEFEI
jgi:hypothetical protein